jgi:hypothetical protein
MISMVVPTTTKGSAPIGMEAFWKGGLVAKSGGEIGAKHTDSIMAVLGL